MPKSPSKVRAVSMPSFKGHFLSASLLCEYKLLQGSLWSNLTRQICDLSPALIDSSTRNHHLSLRPLILA